VFPVDLLDSSVASFILWASPPERVVAGCPNFIYPSPTLFNVSSFFFTIGIFSNISMESSTVLFNISAIDSPLNLIS